MYKILEKNLKRLTTITLSIVMTLSTVVTAYAKDSTASNMSEYKTALLESLQERDTDFTITYTGNLDELIAQMQTVYEDTMLNADEYLYLSISRISASAKGIQGNFVATYSAQYLATKEQEDYVDTQVKTITSKIIKDTMSDYEKIFTIHQYLLDNLTYDYSLLKYSSYNALVDKTVVCQGYAMLFDKMLEEVGLKSTIKVGELLGVGHAWNLVYLDGDWYNIDATNDDINYNYYFLKSDATFIDYGFKWDSTKYLPAKTDYIISTNTENQNSAESLKDATDKVALAETYKKISYVKSAQKAVDNLIDSEEKKNLNTRLTKVLSIIKKQAYDKAVSYVSAAEKSLTEATFKEAQKYVKVLEDTDEKKDLQERLNVVLAKINEKNIIAIEKYVIKAEKYLTESYLKTAQKFVSTLKDSKDKTKLQERLNIVQTKINEQNIKKAESMVIKAEKHLTEPYFKTAQKYVSELIDSKSKTKLQKRLNEVKTEIELNKLSIAEKYVKKAEVNKKSSDIKIAQKYVTALANSQEKTNLQKRLNALK